MEVQHRRRRPRPTVERASQLIDTDPVLSKASKFIDIKNSTDEIPSGAELLYSPAWHGSPHSFDKFSLTTSAPERRAGVWVGSVFCGEQGGCAILPRHRGKALT